MHGIGDGTVVGHVAVHARVLQQHAEGMGAGGLGGGADLDLDAQRQRARAYHFQRPRQYVVRHV
ncbi:hypothetical protein D3C85_1531900 [compost metagenome]